MSPQSARLAFLAFVLLWLGVVSPQPRRATAFEAPSDIGATLHATLEHMEFPLPAPSGTHAVELWNGIVCEQRDTQPDHYSCTVPADTGE